MFDEQFVAGVCHHMNADHADDALRIVRTLGGRPGAKRVETVGVDAQGLRFVAYEDGQKLEVTVPEQVRPAVVTLSRRARTA